MQIHSGQCGLCSHFGEEHSSSPRLIQIRSKHDAPADMLEQCGHPQHAALNLKVTPVSGCAGFEPAKLN
jgi:hypothetical protein